MARRKSTRASGLTRREFVRSSSRATATVAGAALMSALPALEATAGSAALGTRGAVASEPEAVARAGVRMIERGGNAMDAAAAACLAGCMVGPHLADLGGYVCCAVVLEGQS